MSSTKNIAHVLGKIGPTQEALYYWNLYQNTDPTKFAVIKISGECIEKSLDEIANDLSDLQALGLIPVITHGWGSTLTRRLESLGIESKFIDGDRYTDAKVMHEVEKVADETRTKLLKAIEAKGGKAKIIEYADKPLIAKDKERYIYGDHNGDIIAVNLKSIFDILLEGFIPIISPLGTSEDGNKIYNINAAVAGAELVKAIDPIKYIMVTGLGGVLDKQGELISEIVLRKDLKRLIDNGTLSGGMLKNVEEATRSLEMRENGDNKNVQIVRPGNLLYELFTHKGVGTYIRNGYVIESQPLNIADSGIYKAIIERAFGEQLKRDYFQNAITKDAVAYIEKNKKGVAIVLPNPAGVGPYLDILAVGNNYRRNGLAIDIISAILESQDLDRKKLSWRSKTIRDANMFYFKIAKGHQSFKGVDKQDYHAFWIGLTLEEAAKAYSFMQQKLPNFE